MSHADVALRVFDGESGKLLATVRKTSEGRLIVVATYQPPCSEIAQQKVISGDPEQRITLASRIGDVVFTVVVPAELLQNQIAKGRRKMSLFHPSSHRLIMGYRSSDEGTEQAAKIRLERESAALDWWRSHHSPDHGMVRFFERRVDDARRVLAQIRDTRPSGVAAATHSAFALRCAVAVFPALRIGHG